MTMLPERKALMQNERPAIVQAPYDAQELHIAVIPNLTASRITEDFTPFEFSQHCTVSRGSDKHNRWFPKWDGREVTWHVCEHHYVLVVWGKAT